MTLEELEKKLSEVKALHDELKAQFNELKAQNEEKPKPPYPRWMPSKSEEWYAIGTHGSIRHYREDIDSLALDWCTTVANVYRSEDDAKFAIERRRVLLEMREWAGNSHCGVYIYYHKPSDQIMMDWDGNSNYFHGDIRFKSVDDALNCIKSVGKGRMKKYYFMVPEDENV